MALKLHSDASYLSAPKAKSWVEGRLFLGTYSDASNPRINNGRFLVVASIINMWYPQRQKRIWVFNLLT